MITKIFKLIIYFICFTFISTLLLFYILENFYYEDKIKNARLYDLNYYDKNYKSSPYANFRVKYLNPYFFFSLPFKDEVINSINNNVVSLNYDGFRKVNFNSKSKTKNILLLGGSSAFSHFSSSNKTSLASQLSKITDYNLVNRNAPSWNSHQELIALLKYNNNYDLSISFSLANDINIHCRFNKNFNIFPDQQEDFDKISFYFERINNPPNTQFYLNLISINFFNGIKELFPKVYSRLLLSNNLTMSVIEKIYKINDFSKGNRGFENCGNKPDIFVNSFINNQKNMSDISKMRGAEHILIIQPMLGVHDNYSNPSTNEFKTKKLIIDQIINSDLCSEIICINFSDFFNNLGEKEIKFTKFKYEDKEARNNFEKIQPCFYDHVHLLDICIKKVASEISSLLP